MEVKLTEPQRKVLIAMNTISDDVRQMFDVKQKGTKTFQLNFRQTMIIALAAAEAVETGAAPATLKHLEKILTQVADAVPGMRDDDSISIPSLSDVSNITTGYQLKITLKDSKPPIWRRIRVADCALGNLLVAIQVAMGWQDCHLHSFRVGNIEYGTLDSDFDEMEDEWDVTLGALFESGIKKFQYCYDFGDDWTHVIQIESTHERTPDEPLVRCIKGTRACPPEDCGGIWGYGEILEILDDPQHAQHADMIEWLGGKLDPEAFDMDEVNSILASMASVEAD